MYLILLLMKGKLMVSATRCKVFRTIYQEYSARRRMLNEYISQRRALYYDTPISAFTSRLASQESGGNMGAVGEIQEFMAYVVE
jgi:hypothetical protein